MIVKGFFIVVFTVLLSCKQDKPTLITATKNTTIKQKTEVKTKSNKNLTKAFVLGKFNYKTDSLFTKVSPKHSTKTLYLNKAAYLAFIKMNEKAVNDGVTLKIISGTRNFAEQKIIWERKWAKYKNLEAKDRALKILEYSSMPSTSRHHWGTDLDLNNLNNSYFEKGQGKKEYTWIVENANNYGFHQVYTSKEQGRTGYNLERWHWSYLPLANTYLKFYNTHIQDSDINDFKGSELSKNLKIISNYVNGISKN